MTVKSLQKLVDKEKTIWVITEGKLFEVHTQKDYKATTIGLDNGEILIPFSLKKVYKSALEAITAFVSENTIITIL